MRLAAVGSLFALALLAPSSGAAPPPRSELRGEVSVREVEMSVALPDELSVFKVRALDAASFLVLRDGHEQAVARAERINPKDRSWTSVVWVDRVLASPDSALRSAQSLAERAADLARLGSVEVVVAEPLPRSVLAAGADARAIRAALEDAGAAAGRARQAVGEAAWRAPAAAALRQQCDRILAWVAARRAVGPRALWLTMDGVGLSLEALSSLGGRPAPGAVLRPGEAEIVATLEDFGRMLAAYGWTTVMMTSRPAGGDAGSQSPESSYDRWRREALPNKPGTVATLFRWPPLQSRSHFDPRTLAAELEPALAAPRLVAEETGGWLLPGPWDLPAAFAELEHRWRVWLRAEDVQDGSVRPVTIRLKKGGEIRSARWVRSSVPEGIAEARLRQALAAPPGPETSGSLGLLVKSQRLASGVLSIDLAVSGEPLAKSPGEPSGLRRFKAAARAADGTIGFPAVTSVAAADGWHLELTPPPGASALALTLDDLRSERFGVVVLPPLTP